jgi:hypothetical protein
MASSAVMLRTAATVEVAASTAAPGKGAQGVPVPGDGLMALCGFPAALGDVIGPVDGEVAGEQEDLLPGVAQPAAGAHSADSRCPVAQPVVNDPGADSTWLIAIPEQPPAAWVS